MWNTIAWLGVGSALESQGTILFGKVPGSSISIPGATLGGSPFKGIAYRTEVSSDSRFILLDY